MELGIEAAGITDRLTGIVLAPERGLGLGAVGALDSLLSRHQRRRCLLDWGSDQRVGVHLGQVGQGGQVVRAGTGA